MPPPAMQTPPAIVAPAPDQPDPESALLEAFDWGHTLPEAPRLEGPAALEYRWLSACATFDPLRSLPDNPFATGGEQREAEALRNLLKASRDQVAGGLKALPIQTAGTALALWRWGQIQVRSGRFDGAVRRSWEDRLLRKGPAMTRGYALRHALSWALAEQDETRLAIVRAAVGEDSADIQGFQRLFGLLGGPSPLLRLWALPSLEYRDLRLDQLGTARVWISPMEAGPLGDLPPNTTWIVPSASGFLDERAASLPEALLKEGQGFADRLRRTNRTAYFAPSEAAFERLGLVWFPILIVLDAKGAIQSIRMGDAAPMKP